MWVDLSPLRQQVLVRHRQPLSIRGLLHDFVLYDECSRLYISFIFLCGSIAYGLFGFCRWISVLLLRFGFLAWFFVSERYAFLCYLYSSNPVLSA